MPASCSALLTPMAEPNVTEVEFFESDDPAGARQTYCECQFGESKCLKNSMCFDRRDTVLRVDDLETNVVAVSTSTTKNSPTSTLTELTACLSESSETFWCKLADSRVSP